MAGEENDRHVRLLHGVGKATDGAFERLLAEIFAVDDLEAELSERLFQPARIRDRIGKLVGALPPAANPIGGAVLDPRTDVIPGLVARDPSWSQLCGTSKHAR